MNPSSLVKYYTTKFPTQQLKEWISYGGKEPIQNRECAFCFEGDQFIRWHTIESLSTFAQGKQTFNPARLADGKTVDLLERMEIGAVYSHAIADRLKVPTGEFYPQHRELVFDLDSDDFKDIKCCCGDSEICEKCWHFMNCALDCLTQVLANNFGFKNIFPVFSGRRGVHLWVCDKRARELTANVRESIVRYLNLKEITNQPMFSPASCPLLNEIFPTCEKHFVNIYNTQDIFRNKKTSEKSLQLLGSENVKKIIKTIDSAYGDDREKWEVVKGLRLIGKKMFGETPQYYQLIIWYTFPRLDANVTTGMVHLLKSPFSVHPKSGLISLPIPTSRFSELPRTWVPSMEALMSGDDNARETFQASVELLQQHANKCAQSE